MKKWLSNLSTPDRLTDEVESVMKIGLRRNE